MRDHRFRFQAYSLDVYSRTEKKAMSRLTPTGPTIINFNVCIVCVIMVIARILSHLTRAYTTIQGTLVFGYCCYSDCHLCMRYNRSHKVEEVNIYVRSVRIELPRIIWFRYETQLANVVPCDIQICVKSNYAICKVIILFVTLMFLHMHCGIGI